MDRERRQLEWVQRNRTRHRAAEPVGALASRVLALAKRRGPAWKRRLAAVLAEHAGANLLDQVAVVSVRDGVLLLEGADPAMIYHLRLQWELRLVQLLQAYLPAAGVHTVRFRASR